MSHPELFMDVFLVVSKKIYKLIIIPQLFVLTFLCRLSDGLKTIFTNHSQPSEWYTLYKAWVHVLVLDFSHYSIKQYALFLLDLININRVKNCGRNNSSGIDVNPLSVQRNFYISYANEMIFFYCLTMETAWITLIWICMVQREVRLKFNKCVLRLNE